MLIWHWRHSGKTEQAVKQTGTVSDMLLLTEREFAGHLASQIQSVSKFLNVQTAQDVKHTTAATAFSTCTLRHLRNRIASLDKRQATIAERLEASATRAQLCEQQLESKAVSLSSKQHLLATIGAEKLLQTGYAKQLHLLKDSLQDILSSLHETLQLDDEQLTALQGQYSTGSDSLLAQMPGNSQANSPHRAFESSSQLGSSGHSQRTSGLHSTQRSSPKATAHHRSKNSLTGSAAQLVQTSSSLQSTSKSSRYLQRHLLPQPSALQQLQAFADRHTRGSDSGACDSSHADNSTALPDTPKKNLQLLRLRPAYEAVQHQNETASSDPESRAVPAEAEMEDQQPGSGQAVNVQLRQSLLRSHPLPESRPLTPEMSGDDAYMTSAGVVSTNSARSDQAVCRSRSLPLSRLAGAGKRQTGSQSLGLAGVGSTTLLQALQDCVLQLEARASIAECGRAAAQQQLAQVRQQLAEDRRAYEATLAVLTEQIAHQDAVLAGAAKYLGPLESRAIPLSPVLSPRVQTSVQGNTVQEQVQVAGE